MNSFGEGKGQGQGSGRGLGRGGGRGRNNGGAFGHHLKMPQMREYISQRRIAKQKMRKE